MGLTVIDVEVAPVLQLYELAPPTVKVAVSPAQILIGFTIKTGEETTITFVVAEFTQPNVVPKTVYEVLVIGEIIKGFNNEPVSQKYELAPLAINVAVWPAQMVDEFTVTVGKGVTETFAIAVLIQPNAVPITV